MTAAGIHEARRWLDQALEDITSAQVLLDAKRYYLVCFMAHQVAEKALKAYLYFSGEQAVIGHGIQRLAERAAQYDPDFDRLGERISILDTYYIPTRYPNGLPDGIPARAYNSHVAEEALELARSTADAVSERLTRR